MSNVKLKNGFGTEVTYAGVNTVKLNDADSSGLITFINSSDATATANKILSGYTAYIADGTKVTGNVPIYTGDILGIDYLCFTANSAGSTVLCPQTFEYSTDRTSWSTASTSSAITLASVGDKIYIRNGSVGQPVGGTGFGTFVMTGSIAASGSIMSLLDNLVESTTITYDASFYQLFKDCTALTSAPSLPATTLTIGAYNSLFSGCINMVTGPSSIPAASLPSYCCYEMFLNCSSLVIPPTISATSIDGAACYEMFKGCSAMTTVPHLGFSTLADSSMISMFEGCTSITKVNAIVTTHFPDWCCASMYKNCTQLIVAASSSSTTPYAWTMPMTGTATESTNVPFAYIFTGCQSFGETWMANYTVYTNLEPI